MTTTEMKMRIQIRHRVNVEIDEIEIALLQTIAPGTEPGAAIKLALRKLGEGDAVAGAMREIGILLEQVIDRLESTPQQISEHISDRFEQLAGALAPVSVGKKRA